MIDLAQLKVFERVASLGSFAAAARALGLPKSNVSRSVALLEEALGVRLFHRSTREVTTTSPGAALLDRAREIIERVGEAVDYVGSFTQSPRGHIKINSGVGFGINVIALHLPEFLRRYPQVSVTLDLESRSADLIGEAIDIAVRLGPLKDSNLIASRLGAMRRYLCASVPYIENRGHPASMDELQTHDVIEMPGVDGRPRPWVFTRGDEEVRISPLPRVTVNEALTIHRLVIGGAGIGILSGYLAAPAIAEGHLIRLLPDWTLPPIEISLVFPSRRELSPAVRAFGEFLKEMSHPGELWQDDSLQSNAPVNPKLHRATPVDGEFSATDGKLK
jgi:DNA-binding transcriptional LysR family regulator